jgi:hypothetical protein
MSGLSGRESHKGAVLLNAYLHVVPMSHRHRSTAWVIAWSFGAGAMHNTGDRSKAGPGKVHEQRQLACFEIQAI